VLKIPNYSIYHCYHPDGTVHGGAAILIPKALQHYEAPAYQTDKIQAAIIQLQARPWSFNIAAMYSPPRHRNGVEVYDNFLHHLGNKFIVGGDWKAKLKQPDDIDVAVNSFTCLIQEAAWKSTPPTPPGNEPLSSTPLHIRKLVAEKRRARNRRQRSRNPIDKREYNQCTRHLRVALQDSRNATFET
jgi:hypothetical protein